MNTQERTAFPSIPLPVPEAAIPLDATRVTDFLMRSFRFTPMEAAFANLLISGMSVAECARELGVTIHTARSHLKRTMAKTRTNRQGALIGLLLREMPRPERGALSFIA